MTENPMPASMPGATAGAMLKAAREQQGIHLAVLAAAIKISTRKLDSLEGDRYGELPDPAFTRALAQTVARALKIDPQPVLALLPAAASASKLESVSEGLNTPFKDRSGTTELSALLPRAPLVWAGLALLAAAALLLYWPYRQNLPMTTAVEPALTAPAPAAGGSVAPMGSSTANTAGAAVSAQTSVPAPTAAASAVASAPSSLIVDATPSSAGLAPPAIVSADSATVTVSDQVWLEVIDGTGSVVFMRTLQPGEVVNFDERLPLRLKLGNAPAAKVTFRGETIDLVPVTRGSVARVVLK